jgi:hypothetical protein
MSKVLKVAIIGGFTAVAVTLILLGQMHRGPHILVPARTSIPDEGVSLPMLDEGGRPVVEVTIDGKGPFKFILDTAATASVIGVGLNRMLALEPLKSMTADSAGKAPQAIVQIQELKFGGAVLGGLYTAVMPVEEFFPGESRPVGVLNATGFPGYLVTFDYPHKLISIKKGVLDSADSFDYSDTLPALPFRVAGREISLDMDTGSAGGLVLPAKWISELPLTGPTEEVKQVRTPAGGFPASEAKVKGVIELGKYKLDLSEVTFSDAHGGSGKATGQVGYEVLRRFIVTLDSKNRRIRLEQ